MTGEGQETTRAGANQAEPCETIKRAAILEMELAQGFLGLMLAQWRTGSGDEQARAYARQSFHAHARNVLVLLNDSTGEARLEAMQPQGSA